MRYTDSFQPKADISGGFQNDSMSGSNTASLKEAPENYEKSSEQIEKILSLGEPLPVVEQKRENTDRRTTLIREKIGE